MTIDSSSNNGSNPSIPLTPLSSKKTEPHSSLPSSTSSITATPTKSKPTNFETDRWDKIPTKDSCTYKYTHTCKNGKAFTITQQWPNKYSDEFIVGSIKALADLYENSTPQIRNLIQEKLKRGENPHFVEMVNKSNDSKEADQTIGYMIAWPPNKGSEYQEYFCFSQDETGQHYMLRLDTTPGNIKNFKQEMCDIFFNRSDRYFSSSFKRLLKKINDNSQVILNGPNRGYVIFPHEKFGKTEGVTEDGRSTIQEQIQKIAEHLKKLPKIQVSAEKISSNSSSTSMQIKPMDPTLKVKPIQKPVPGNLGSNTD